MKLSIQAGATSQSINVFISDSSSTTGAGLTGLAYNTSSLVAYYTHSGANATANAITLATLAAVNSAYSSGGFKEIDSTNMPGWYRLDLPNAVLATSKGRVVSLHLKGAANMAPCPIEIELTGWDNQDTVRGGLTALPNVASGSAGAIITSGTGTAQLSVSSGVAQADIAKCGGSTVAAGALPNVAAGSTGGLILIGTGTRDINPNAGGVVITATGMQSFWDLLTSSQSTSGSIGKAIADNLTGNAYTRLGAPAGASIAADIATRLATSGYTAPLDAAGTRSAVGLASANLDTQLSGINSKTTNLPSSFPTNFSTFSIDSSGRVNVAGFANNAITTASITDGAITDAKFTVPSPASGLATGFIGMVQQLWRRSFKKTTFDSATGYLKTYANDGTTVYTTETCTESGGVQTKGAAS